MKKPFYKNPLETILIVFMFALAVVCLIPIAIMLRNTFAPSSAVLNLKQLFVPSIDTLKYVWSNAPFGTYYINTIILVVCVLAVQFVTITLAGYAFARLNFYGKNFIFVLFLAQIMISGDILLLPNYKLISQMGLTNTLLGVMLPSFVSALGVIIMRQNIKTIPYELEEAAKIDGCNQLRIILNIYVPLLKPAYIAFGMISASYQWNNFLWPLIIVNSQNKRPLTTGLAIFAKAAETGAQWDVICAATFIVAAPLLIVFVIFQRQFIESFANSGIK